MTTMLSLATFTGVVLPLAFLWKVCLIPLEAILRGIGWWKSPAAVPKVDMTQKVVVVTGANTGQRRGAGGVGHSTTL